jgi:hypothetical protein
MKTFFMVKISKGTSKKMSNRRKYLQLILKARAKVKNPLE